MIVAYITYITKTLLSSKKLPINTKWTTELQFIQQFRNNVYIGIRYWSMTTIHACRKSSQLRKIRSHIKPHRAEVRK